MSLNLAEPSVIDRHVKLCRWKDGEPTRIDYYGTVRSVRNGGLTDIIMYTVKSSSSSVIMDLFAWQFEFVKDDEWLQNTHSE